MSPAPERASVQSHAHKRQAVRDGSSDADDDTAFDAEVMSVSFSPAALSQLSPEALRQLVEEQAAHGSGWSTLAAALGHQEY